MASQDKLRWVGNSVDEPMVQDTTPMHELCPQPNSESEMGAVGAAAQERPLRQTPLPTLSETATDRGRSASQESSGIEQIIRMMQAMGNEMKENAQRMNGKMDDMKGKFSHVLSLI